MTTNPITPNTSKLTIFYPTQDDFAPENTAPTQPESTQPQSAHTQVSATDDTIDAQPMTHDPTTPAATPDALPSQTPNLARTKEPSPNNNAPLHQEHAAPNQLAGPTQTHNALQTNTASVPQEALLDVPTAPPAQAPSPIGTALAQTVSTIALKPTPIPTPAPAEPLPPLEGGAMGVLDELLRHRPRLLRRLLEGDSLPQIARAAMVTIVITMAVMGASMGFYRGGLQILYAAIKLPLVMLLTAAITAPVYSAIKTALQHKASVMADFALILSALALTCLVTVALAPVLLLGVFQQTPYHKLILLLVGLFGLGGAAGYVFFFKGINQQLVRGHRLICVTLLVAMGLVGSQMAWLTRPYLVRPASQEVPMMRAFEGSFMDAVLQSTRSARGIYKSDVRPGLKLRGKP